MGYGYGKHSLDLQAHRETSEIIDLSPDRVEEYVEESHAKLQKVKQPVQREVPRRSRGTSRCVRRRLGGLPD